MTDAPPPSTAQLPFDLGSRSAYGREDFFVSECNAHAVAWLDRWPDWPSPLLILQGNKGSGKTHLAHVFKERLAGKALICDDIDAALARKSSYALEQDIFHAYNRFAGSGIPLLLTSVLPPAQWHIKLADLRSRIAAAPVVKLGSPDDQLMAVVMTKMFSDRQIYVGQDVVSYVLKRIERSFAAIGVAVAAIDQAALAQKRAITVPLVKAVLDVNVEE